MLAALGDRFPEETRALVHAHAPAKAGHARRRWVKKALHFITHLQSALRGGQAVVTPHNLWLPVSLNDLSVYCGSHDRPAEAPARSSPGPVQAPAILGGGSPSLPSHRWCCLRPQLLLEVASALRGRAGLVWATLAQWIAVGFPLHYDGVGRSTPPLGPERLGSATRALAGTDPIPLRKKLDELLRKQGPTFGPYATPPFERGIVSPVLGVPKKDGSVRPVYHCSFPRSRKGETSTRSLNGGISRADFWFPVLDSVASWLLQWYLHADPAAPPAEDHVIFKLDFESAFRQIPIRQEDWPLLMLYDAADRRYLLETCAAFGTRISSDLWLRVANVWKVFLHAMEFHATMIYVDDLAVICPAHRVWQLFETVTTLEEELGTRVHWGKVFPDGGCTGRASVLGVVVDLDRFTLSLDPKKVRNRLAQARGLLASAAWPVKVVEKLVGALNFFATALPSGRLLLGPIYALTGGQSTNVSVGPRHAARQALEIWCDLLQCSLRYSLEQPFLYAPPSVFWLATDASDTGMGGVSAFGAWSTAFDAETDWSINVRELAAVWVSITQVWSGVFQRCLVHVFVDNDTARAWGGHPPSTRTSATSRALVVALQRALALHLQKSNCTLVMHRIPTLCNDVADRLSREPLVVLPHGALRSWSAKVTSEVNTDPTQQQAVSWLASHRTDTPLLWWETKPTLLTDRAPPYVKCLFPDYDQVDPLTFHRRPLLHLLMQRSAGATWQHNLLDYVIVARWLKSQRGLEVPRV